MHDGSTRRFLDMQLSVGGSVALGEFKASASEFMHGVGQLIGYERRMSTGLVDGKPTAYAEAKKKGKATLFVATPTEPDAFDVETARRTVPPVLSWVPGMPAPLSLYQEDSD